MLEQILDYIHNYFERNIERGKFTVTSGGIDVDFLQNGQYFKICGSVFNDGIHQYPTSDLVDEVFEGEVWAMAVPPAVIALSEEIQSWVSVNSSVIDSPYQSESFGGYSYTKGDGNNAGKRTNSPSWAGVFGSRLNRWRKIS